MNQAFTRVELADFSQFNSFPHSRNATEGLEKKSNSNGTNWEFPLRRVRCVVELIQQIQQIENCVLHQVSATYPN